MTNPDKDDLEIATSDSSLGSSSESLLKKELYIHFNYTFFIETIFQH